MPTGSRCAADHDAWSTLDDGVVVRPGHEPGLCAWADRQPEAEAAQHGDVVGPAQGAVPLEHQVHPSVRRVRAAQPEDRRRHRGVPGEAGRGRRPPRRAPGTSAPRRRARPAARRSASARGVMAAGDVPRPVRRRDRQRLVVDRPGRGREEDLRRARVARNDHLRRRRAPVLRGQALRDVSRGRASEAERDPARRTRRPRPAPGRGRHPGRQCSGGRTRPGLARSAR